MIAFAWTTFLGGAAAGIILVGALLGAVGQIGKSVKAVRQFVQPSEPNVTVSGPGASMSRETDVDGWARWGKVALTFTIHNNQPEGIYSVTTGVKRREQEQQETFPVSFPVIGAEKAQAVNRDDCRIPAEWLNGYGGQNPQNEVLYWVRFEDAKRRGWELTYDPQTAAHSYKRIRR